MERRKFLQASLLLPAFSLGGPAIFSEDKPKPFKRVRPGEPQWPSESSWQELNKQVGGNLIKLDAPFSTCALDANGDACKNAVNGLKNPYYIGDDPALTQTSGWFNAWTSSPSVYAVSAHSTADVVAAVNFARKNNLRLVVKGGGHSYQGTSNAADSLLVWTRAMKKIELHDKFVGQGCAGKQAPQPAVTIESGALWIHAYDAVSVKGGRYVQGGGCMTVGVAGLIQGGGFGSFSKNFGLAAAGLLEVEIVTADGAILIANTCKNAELFWALKGGGGGSLGVVTKLTLRTRELPATFGGAFGKIKATSDQAFKALIDHIISFYHDRLFNPHWGEQIRFHADNTVSIMMVFQGLSTQQANEQWQPFKEWIGSRTNDYQWEQALNILSLPAQNFWDAAFLQKNVPHLISMDSRPGAPEGNISWAGDTQEAGQFLHAYHSAWLPASLIEKNRQGSLAATLFAASRFWTLSLHFNKGLAGAPQEEITQARDTAINPAVLDAFALVIIAGASGPAYPGIPGRQIDEKEATEAAGAIRSAIDEFLKLVPRPGSYVSEGNFFEKDWQQAFWGSNYSRLLKIKNKYDPQGLFFVHHGVGSEQWSDDGFVRR